MSRQFTFENVSLEGSLERRLSMSGLVYATPEFRTHGDDDPLPPEPDPGPLPPSDPPIILPPLPPSGPVGPG